MSPHAPPFYCPYCAEETIEPTSEKNTWHCLTCDRRFEVRFLGSGEE